MNTPLCCGPVILNYALGKPFYVCTECKLEVFDDPTVPPVYAPNVIPVISMYPSVPTPISVEEVKSLEEFEQLELFNPWMDGHTLSINSNKEEPTNG